MIKQIIKQVIKGLQFLSQKLITFTDLKPHNIFVYFDKEWGLQVQLNDYYIEQTFDPKLAVLKNRYGSIYFTPPEVVENTHE